MSHSDQASHDILSSESVIVDIQEEMLTAVIDGVQVEMPITKVTTDSDGSENLHVPMPDAMIQAALRPKVIKMLEESTGKSGPFVEALAGKICAEVWDISKDSGRHEDAEVEVTGGSTGSAQLSPGYKCNLLWEIRNNKTKKGKKTLTPFQREEKVALIKAHFEVRGGQKWI